MYQTTGIGRTGGNTNHTNEIGTLICNTSIAATSCKFAEFAKHPTAIYTRYVVFARMRLNQLASTFCCFTVFLGGQILQNAGNGMFQVVQPMQTVTVDGQEALFIPNMGAAGNQLNGAQPIQIGGQQAFLTPNGQIIRAPGVMPANILQNMGQTVSLPTGKLTLIFGLS